MGTRHRSYVNRGATLEQRAGWNLTNLALGMSTMSIVRNLVMVTPHLFYCRPNDSIFVNWGILEAYQTLGSVTIAPGGAALLGK